MSQAEATNPIGRMEMSQNLRTSLERANRFAYEQSHRQVTLEHLLLALLEDREAAVIVEASEVDMASVIDEVSNFVGRLDDRVTAGERREPELGPEVQHIIRSAGAAAQKSSRRIVGSALVLAAIVGDGRSQAARILRRHGLTFEHAIAALKRSTQEAPSAAGTSRAAAAATAGDVAAVAVAAAPPLAPSTSPQAPFARPAEVHGRQPTPLPGATSDAAAPLQNVQAAHDIIAGARERIAAARSAIAARAPVMQPRPADQPDATPGPRPEPRRQTEQRPGIAMPPLEPMAHNLAHQDRTAAAVPTAPQNAPPPERAILPGPPINPPAQPTHDAYRQPPQPPRGPSVGPSGRTGTLHSLAPEQAPPADIHARPGPAPQQQPPARHQPNPPQFSPHHPATDETSTHRALPHQVPIAQPLPHRPAAPRGPLPPGYLQGHPAEQAQADAAARALRPQPFVEPPAHAQPIEPGALIAGLPSRMCVGVATTIEIRAPRAGLEAWSGANDPRAPAAEIIMKAMVMRLKAPAGGFTIESASPETQWSEGHIGPLSDDVVSWRWIVTPVASGARPLQLAVLTRVVGRDRLAAACALPEQTVTVRVSPNYGRIAARSVAVLLIAGAAGALGYFGESLLRMAQAILAQ